MSQHGVGEGCHTAVNMSPQPSNRPHQLPTDIHRQQMFPLQKLLSLVLLFPWQPLCWCFTVKLAEIIQTTVSLFAKQAAVIKWVRSHQSVTGQTGFWSVCKKKKDETGVSMWCFNQSADGPMLIHQSNSTHLLTSQCSWSNTASEGTNWSVLIKKRHHYEKDASASCKSAASR